MRVNHAAPEGHADQPDTMRDRRSCPGTHRPVGSGRRRIPPRRAGAGRAMKVASVGAATQAIADHTTSRALARGVAGSLGRPPPLGQSCGLGLCPGRVQDRAQTAHDPRIGGITGPLSRRHSPLAQIVKAVGGRQGETGCGIGQGACDAWPMGARHDDGCTATAPWRIASVRPQRPEPTTSHREPPHGRAQAGSPHRRFP